MKLKVEKKAQKSPADLQIRQEEFEAARTFAKRIYAEFKDFVKAIVIFGSLIKKKERPNDIDVLVVLDDVTMDLNEELVETYRIITEKIIFNTDKRLHVQSMKFTTFWEYVRAGDPVAINILRYGLALIDTGFFDPLQRLLDDGRIRPSKEAVHTYFALAPASLKRGERNLLSALADFYWAAIDASHAALMHVGEIPPTPEHVAGLLVEKKILSKKSSKNMEDLYTLFKKLTNRELKKVTGKEYDAYYKKSRELVDEAKRFIERHKGKL